MAAWILHGEVVAAGDAGQLVCEAVASTLVLTFFFLRCCSCRFKLLWVCLCVRNSLRLWNPWLQIALERLFDCCHLVLPCAEIHAGLLRDAAKRIVMAA